jgi:AcrR family transcriptional regulator
MSTTATELGSTRMRLLEATGVALARYGPRKLSLTDIASLAGVSRPTLYRYFASREALLEALAEYEKERFRSGLSDALDGRSGPARLDRALTYIVEFQRRYPMRNLVATEPGFMLGQLEQALRSMAPALIPLFEERWATTASGAVGPADLADLVVRTALSHFLMEGGDDAQLLRELRHIIRRSG